MQRNWFAGVLSAAILIFACSTAWAGGDPDGKIRRLIELDGAGAVVEAVIDRQRPLVRQRFKAAHPTLPNKAVDAYVDAFAGELSARGGQFFDLIVAVYAKTFSAAEIDGLLAFYTSPLGQKLRTVGPSILRQSRDAGAAWGRQHGAAVAATAKAKVKAMGYAVN
ncbi:MAG: DUF2059 domain-containing protein [Alphaproteobacteria bacterium]|jgi:hypothetical protein|nr:DUF2059 domain-containing protein [Alphaproteobacteria bacterium]MDP6564905.1 DUF2059 domain-containing protein [Alphaproteobacteria bacterium]MDP6815356.1 DUF2059 domain-containing protein [Alphaproteobacteria bacterium]